MKRKRAVKLNEFLNTELPRDQSLLGNSILAGSLIMLVGPRGVGKSFLAQQISYCVAAGIKLSPWGKGAGVPVCYVDAEMRATGIQDRLKPLHAKYRDKGCGDLAGKNFTLVSRDYAGEMLGAVDSEQGQQELDQYIPSDARLIVLDNMSALTSGGREDAESWAPVKRWLLRKRTEKKAVLFVHHTGKNGQQRGTSAHEDLLDLSILVEPIVDDLAFEGVRLRVSHQKIRDHLPNLRKDREIRMSDEEGVRTYSCVDFSKLLTGVEGEIIRLATKGVKNIEIAKQLDLTPSKVSRTLTKARSDGLLN